MIIDSNESIDARFGVVANGALLSKQAETVLLEKPDQFTESHLGALSTTMPSSEAERKAFERTGSSERHTSRVVRRVVMRQAWGNTGQT